VQTLTTQLKDRPEVKRVQELEATAAALAAELDVGGVFINEAP
jgi:hypothetical protein